MKASPAERAFTEYATAKRPHLRRLAVGMLGPAREDADDLVQEALLRLAAHWSRTRAPDAYVRKVLTNLVIDRSRRAHLIPLLRRWEQNDDADLPSLPDHADRLDNRADLISVLADLPPRQRQVLVLRYVEDASEAEIAALLGISAGAVKSYASRGLTRLRGLLTPETSDESTRPPSGDQR